MKGYRITHNEKTVSGRVNFIEQCNFHGLKEIKFYGFVTDLFIGQPIKSTVAIFKIKWKS